jgi:hypothetical protein
MQIPIISGIYADRNSDFRSAYPRNLLPVAHKQGISNGYLRPADGILEFATGPGLDRGGVNWKGTLYRLMGSKLCSVSSSGVVSILGDVGGTTAQETLDYSFDKLAVSSNGTFWLWDGTALAQVTDVDLGVVLDFIFVDGYFMTTDGSYIVVTDLNNPFSVNPLKYGSAEADPDPIKGLVKIRNEPYAVGRYTIEVFNNVGGSLFPFQRVSGAQIMKGSVGTHSFSSFNLNNFQGIAFLGGGRNEPPSIWFGVNGSAANLATREIDSILQSYSEVELESCVLETRVDKTHNFLYIHLPDQTLVYDSNTSQLIGEPVWFTLVSSLTERGQYKGRNLVWAYDKWVSGSPLDSKLGYFTNAASSHYGSLVAWEFSTQVVYAESEGVIFHELELIALSGNSQFGADPTVWTSYTTDGVTWSQERPRTAGKQGQRDKRLNWLQQGNMKNWRIQKFKGTSDAHISIARLECRIEQLSN